MSTLDPEPRDAFLVFFPEHKRGTVANWMLQPIRELHADTPFVVLAAVKAQLERRMRTTWSSDEARDDAQRALAYIQAHRDEALACAQYYIAYEQLPEHEKEALKHAQRAEHRDAWMAEKPPTEKQLGYLRKLGYAGATPGSMLEASWAIDHMLEAQKAVTR